MDEPVSWDMGGVGALSGHTRGDPEEQRVKESERGCKRVQEELVSLGCWVFFFK